MTESALQKAERQLAQAKARLQALRNREATKSRKMDTRRKVILGGALMDLASRDGAAAAMVDRLLRNLPRDQDRAAFDGWSLGVRGSGAGTANEGNDPSAEHAGTIDATPGTDSIDPDLRGGNGDDVGTSAAPAAPALDHGDRA